jgi:hypothetical protein
MDGDVIQAAVMSLFVALVAALGLRPVTDRMLGRWEVRFHVLVPDRLRAAARRRLRRDRAVRTTAVAVGLLLGSSPAFVNLIDPARSGDFANPALGHAWLVLGALGALLAQVAVSHRRPAGPVRAALVRREIGDYVPLGRLWLTMAVAGVAVVLATAASVAPADGVTDGEWWWFDALGAVVAVAAAGYGLRMVRDRPMVFVEGAERDLDEATRADGAHHLVGASLALAAICALDATRLVFPAPVALVAQLAAVYLAVDGLALARYTRWDVAARRSVAR